MKPAMNSKRAGAVSPLLVILILCISGVGLLGTFWWMGDISLPAIDHLRDGPVLAASNNEGKVAVPIAARDVPAYRKVRRDDFWLPETQEFASVWLDEDVVAERGIMTAKQVLNRVLAMDKKKGYAFSEDDFLPIGTREGPAAGIEPGMRGLRVSADAIAGLHGLRRGDRFDLIATQNIEKSQNSRDTSVSPLAKAAASDDEPWEVSTRIIVQNGKLVEPVRARQSLASNVGRNARVEEAFLGIAEDEITRLTEALALGAKILCVPRSALPGAGETDLMARARPAGPGVVEVYSKGRRSLTYVPRGRDYTDRYEPDFYMDEEEWEEAQGVAALPELLDEEVAAVDQPLAELETSSDEVAVVEEPVMPIVEAAIVEAAFTASDEALQPFEVTRGPENVADEIARVEVGEVAEEPVLMDAEPIAMMVEEVAPEPELLQVAVAEPAEMTVMDAIVSQELGSEVANAGRFLGVTEPQVDDVVAQAITEEVAVEIVEDALPSQLLEDPMPVVIESVPQPVVVSADEIVEEATRLEVADGAVTEVAAAEMVMEVVPEVVTPEVVTPEVATPEVATPEVVTPEVVTPEVVTPEVVTPEVATPEVATPEVVTPEVVTPEVVTPEVVTPEVVTPEVVTPEVVTPEVVTPEVVTPEVVTPEVVTPEVVTPEVVTPEVVTPEVVTPESEQPTQTPATDSEVIEEASPDDVEDVVAPVDTEQPPEPELVPEVGDGKFGDANRV